MSLQQSDAAVLYIMGQSNAHAHEQMLSSVEMIETPLKNVHTLNRSYNQSFENDHVEWSGFTSASFNLGETQDHTASLAYFTAKAWQTAIDEGNSLPDLYIVQISIGAQGLFAGFQDEPTGMWNPQKPIVMHPGELSEVDIALYPFALHTLRLVHADLDGRFQNPCVLGLHWLGSEEDTAEGYCRFPEFTEVYDRFFDALTAAVGWPCPLFLYELCCFRRETVTAEGMAAVNAVFARQCQRQKDACIVSARSSPLWNSDDPHLGIFAADDVHYLAETQRWFSEELMKNI